MKDISLIERIKQIGLSEYEAKCYLALFQRESLAVSEVIKITGIPRPDAYRAMEKLLGKGMSIAVSGKTKRYKVSDPLLLKEKSLTAMGDNVKSELEDLEKKQQNIVDMRTKKILELEKKQREILDKKKREIINKEKDFRENMDVIFDGLYPLYKNSRHLNSPLEYIQILKDPRQMLLKYTELANQAQEEILEFSKPPFVFKTSKKKISNELIHIIKGVNDDLSKRKVVSRNIWDSEARDDLIHFIKINNQVNDRVVEELPIKMIVFDRKIVFYHLPDPVAGKPSNTSLVTEHPHMANAFVALFESFWEKAVPFDVFLNSENTARKKKGKN